MLKQLRIRPEHAIDQEAIERVIQAAFLTAIYSNQTEHCLVNDLRKAQALSLSLVAEYQQQIIGHIAFSKVAIDEEDQGWYGLAPLAVDPNWQNQGVGVALVEAGLKALKALDAAGCVVLGDPDYYGRFGFQASPHLSLADVPAAYFLGLSFKEHAVLGAVEYHAAFANYA